MSVLSIAQDILIVVKAVQMIVVEIRGNKNKAQRLVTRINTIIPTIYMITQDPSKVVCSVERLQDLLTYISGIKAFIDKFVSTSYFGKAWNIGKDNLAFQEFNDGLGVRIEALQFNIQVSAEKQRQEDQQDAEADAEEMKGMIQAILEGQGVMQAEINNRLNEMMIQNQSMFSEQSNAILASNAEILKQLTNLSMGQTGGLPSMRTIAPEQLEYSEDDATLIGQGSFGAIYEGTYLGMDVAIKTIKNPNITRAMKDEMQKEALTMQMLDFPGIIHFYGANLDSAPRFIVMERALCSLYDLLYQPLKYTPHVDFNLYAKLDLMGDIARSIEYIHSMNIVHGDIKSHNILLSADMKPKITDFGLAKGKGVANDTCSLDNADGSRDFKGSPAYLAPEIFLESNYSKFSDVYSFSVVMNEILSRQVPFDRVSTPDIMHRCVTAKTRPAMFTMDDLVSCVPHSYSLDPSLMMEVAGLITKGWNEIPSQRPLFHVSAKALERIANSIKGGGGMLALDAASNGKSHKNGSGAKEAPMDAAKAAVFDELSSWLVKKVEMFPDTANRIAKLFVSAGVTSINKLDGRIKKLPNFLDTLGVSQFEAADIMTALENDPSLAGSEPVTPRKGKRVSAEAKREARSDPQYERNLRDRARGSVTVGDILEVLNGVMQIEPLTVIHKDTLREVFKVVANLGFNNVPHQTELGREGACGMVGNLLYAYHSGLEQASRMGNMGNFDPTVLEAGLWCVTVLAINNARNQRELGTANVPALIVALLNRHGSSNPAIAEQGLRAIENLTLEASNRDKFGAEGICQVLTNILGMYCSVNNSIVEHALAAISNLCRDSPANQNQFMRCNVCPPLMNALVVLGTSMVSVADYAMYTIRSLCLDNPENVLAFVAYDIVGTILQMLYSHGSHYITVTESGLGALAVLCCTNPTSAVLVSGQKPQPNPHMNLLYYNLQAVNMVFTYMKSYSAKSKPVTTSSFQLYAGILNFMCTFGGNPFQPTQVVVNRSMASDAQLRDWISMLVAAVRTHGVTDQNLVEAALALLNKITFVAVSGNILAVFSAYAEVNIGAVVVDILHQQRSQPKVVAACVDMLISLSGLAEYFQRFLAGPNTNLYKFVLEVVGSLNEHGKCGYALLESGVRLYTIMYQKASAAEANQGDPVGCKFLLHILESTHKHCFESSHVPVAGVTPIVTLQTVLVALQMSSSYAANKAHLGHEGACKLLCTVAASFTTDPGLSARFLEILANLAMLNTNDPKLVQAGACKLIIDLLIAFAYPSPEVAAHGIRALANLAVANKLMLAELNVCPILCDVIRYYVSTNNAHADGVLCQAAVCIFNMASHCAENRQRFASLNIAADLQSLLTSRSISQLTRDQLKDAVNAIRFE